MTTKDMQVRAPETPSTQIVRAAAKTVDVTDELGRVITLKKPSPLDNLDFAKAAGAGAEGVNQVYLSMIGHLKYVAAIDGEPIVTPGSDAEIRALYARLDEEGSDAILQGVIDHFMPKDLAAKDDAVKNS
jgi:hypothetical protein